MKNNVVVIGLNGSPNRGGNTVTLMNWVLGGCAEAGAAVERLHICDFDIQYCLGCRRCLKEGRCPLDDDYESVLEKIRHADGIVIGTPVCADVPRTRRC